MNAHPDKRRIESTILEPEPVFEFTRPGWQSQANCRPRVMPHIWQQFEDCKVPNHLFFPKTRTSNPGVKRLAEEREASKRRPQGGNFDRRDAILSVCGACPVCADCFEWGVEHERYGWWGGVPPEQLDAERRRRGLRVVTPEIDVPRSRRVMGTFIPEGHGSEERYQLHHKAGERACKMCLSAHREWQAPEASARWAETLRTETPEDRRARLDEETTRRARVAATRRQGA